MTIHKGDKVRVKAEVFTAESVMEGEEVVYHPDWGNRKLIRRALRTGETTGWVVGYTFRHTGAYQPARPEYGEFGSVLGYDPPYFETEKVHKVWLVEWDGWGDRYTEPFVCLEEDLEVIENE